MPFNFQQYEQQCSRMSKVELRREIEHQNDVVASAGAGTGFAVLAIPLTMGLSAIAVGATAPALINARQKKSIAKKYLAGPGPEVGPSNSTQAVGPRPVNSRPAATSNSQSAEEQLPAYTPGDGVPDRREKQTFVPMEESDMDLPPSYDEATLKRMTMMGLRPPFTPRRQLSSPATSSGNGSGGPFAGLESPVLGSSYHASHDLDRTSSPLSPHAPSIDSPISPIGPAAPSPGHTAAPVNLLGDDESQHRLKGRAGANPFISVEESENVQNHT